MDNSLPENWFSLKWFSLNQLLSYEWAYYKILYLLLLIPIAYIVSRLLNKKITYQVSIPKSKLKNLSYSFFRIIPNLLFICSLIMVILSLARPQKSNEKIDRWSEGIDIMLVVDISESMQIEDFSPNRLESAKSVAKKFIDGRFQDRIGLVVFSGESYSRCPLTSDYTLLKKYIDEINFDLISTRGTAIGSAIAIATNRMRESKSKTKILILLSDGDNTAGNIDPKTAAEIAKAYGIKIYSIAIGKNGKVPFGKDYFGRPRYVENSLDEKNLRDIAKTTEGKFYRASNNTSLENIFSEIDEFEKSEIKENRYKNTVDFYQYYLLWGIIFILLFIFIKSTYLNNILKD
ncbi:MAG: vWA domain-containing protein [Cytophagales bacterium]